MLPQRKSLNDCNTQNINGPESHKDRVKDRNLLPDQFIILCVQSLTAAD